MKLITLKGLPALALALSLILLSSASAQEDPALFLGKATAKVAHAMAFKNLWDGPTTGPRLAPNKFIAFIGADIAGDSSQQKLANAVKEVAASLGWNVMVLDCYGLPRYQPESFVRALALKPAAIIFAGADAKANAKQIGTATDKKIPVIGWNAALSQGPGDGLFTNIGTEPKEAGQLAAMLGVVESKAKAGFVVLADTSTTYLATKSLGMIDTIKQCQTCSLLSVEQVTATDKPEQLIARIVGLQKQYGPRLTYVMATNDRMFDFLASPAAAAIDAKTEFISAGYGSSSAYARIRTKKGQMGTVAEPLTLQAYQLMDEINRALAGEKPSGFIADPYVVTLQNISFHGGQNNVFDPSDGYKDAYKKIWGR